MQTEDVFIIAGAGIGGLATALALQKNGFSYEIYERDADFYSRRQGYSLTIQKNGFEALQELGVGEHVREMGKDSVICGTTTYNHRGEIIFSKAKRKNNRYDFNNFAVPRQSLRECLMRELKPNIIQWNKEILRYELIEGDPHRIQVIFTDHTSTFGCALIACDGVHSAIRRQALGDDLNYLGVWAINGIASHQQNPIFVNQTVQMLDGKSRLFIKPYSLDKSMWQLTFQVSKDDHTYNQNDLNDLLCKAKYTTKDWHEPMMKLISDTSVSDVRAGPIFDRDPLETIGKDLACVTMLGDAVHPMSPFKGQGANQALMDAIDLVKFLMKYRGKRNGVEQGFSDFEVEMLKRSKRYVLQSRSAVEFLHTNNALRNETMSQFVREKLLQE
ncbi:unnamed protein product [Adineta ricciae]|uniref:FAD-binding domain-containing protein n=1 Tax=Adineta ricciae TaxID=249248 RepID=A0A814JK18_ADIRI|nr:unnamed protein product [Adineta ricciae]CAF1036893.1 unnamed protein product [Adineta ricciae]